jgi:hypothetical protein
MRVSSMDKQGIHMHQSVSGVASSVAVLAGGSDATDAYVAYAEAEPYFAADGTSDELCS